MRFMTKPLELNQILNDVQSFAKTETVSNMILELKPSRNIEEIEKALTEVNDMTALIIRMGSFPLIADFDIYELLKYAELDRAFSITDLLYIRLFLSMEKDIIQYIREYDRQKINVGLIASIASQIISHRSLFDEMNRILDPDGLILDDASPALYNIRRQILKHEKSLQDKLSKMLTDYASYLNEFVIVMRNNRFCIPVKEAFKHKIKGIVHDMSASKQTFYIEPEQTRQITAEIESLRVEEEKEIQRIIYVLSQEIHQSSPTLKNNLDQLIQLDFINAKALHAKAYASNKPHLNQVGHIKLVSAKHPLLDQKSAVPISIELDEHTKILLITGPNTGGKTVALKTVGLLTLMTQVGLLIPAHESTEIAIFDQVFADIGDEQSISQNLSTFSSHLTKIIDMVADITPNTLVLLDEIGSGTDPNEGVSLAIAILNYFKSIDLRMMVTTHYSELKTYAYEHPYMGTASVAFDKKTLKPLYYLHMGTTGSSHAFLIAKRLGMPQEIIDDATHIYQGRQTDLAKIMEKLNDEILSNEHLKDQLSSEIKLHQDEKVNYQKLREKLRLEQDQIIEKIKQKEEEKWNALKDEARQLIKELQQKDTLSKPEVAQLKFQLNQKEESSDRTIIDEDLKVGDLVFILPYQQYGKITQIKGEIYQVTFGQFDLQFEASDLRKEEPKKEVKKTVRQKKISQDTVPTKKASFELDLRGFRFEEVKFAMDDAIDAALLSGLAVIRIIHGFGSGAVRKAVYDYIKQSPYIKSHRFGGEGEGLNGVTIITLK